jgi:DNA polymerase-1
MTIYVIDFETGPYDPTLKSRPHAFALEPYRNEFHTTWFCVVGSNGYHKVISHKSSNYKNDLLAELAFLNDKVVFAHNAGFDISCCLSVCNKDLLTPIKWRDSALLAKWVENAQDTEHQSYSLRDCVERHLPDELAFISMKDEATTNPAYWAVRVLEDCRVTLKLVEVLLAKLPVEQYNGFIIEQACLLPLAEATMQGILLDENAIDLLSLQYQVKINTLCKELGVLETTISSPAKLGQLLFDQWGYEPISKTATGKASTRAGDIKMLIFKNQEDRRLAKLAAIKSLITVRNKYLTSFQECIKYLGEPVLRPRIKFFNSYTGRATYSSKLTKKFPVAIAFHQLPRKFKEIKKAMIAPPGYRILYGDFASQEIRLIAEYSQDPVMLDALSQNKDLHAIMAEGVFGTPYDEIVAKKDTDEAIKNIRDGGKMINLSSQYRIGSNTFVVKAFEQYDKVITKREADHYLGSYKKTFKGIPEYWKSAIKFAHANGFASTLSGRRYGISKMDWSGESSAINTPIQGSGADLLELVIALVGKQFPQLIFQLTVHDSVSWLIPDGMNPEEVTSYVNNIDYSKYYGRSFSVNFPLDFAIGPNFADLKPL